MQPGQQPDMSALLAQAQQVQQQLMEAQEALAVAEVHGQAGGGLVQITMKGSGEVVAVSIDPKVARVHGNHLGRQLRRLPTRRNRSPSSLRPGWVRWPAGWVAWAYRESELFEGPVQDLIDELGKLPGIGPKSAQRIAFHLLSVEPPYIYRLTAVLGRVRDGVTFCSVCGNVSDDERCRICSDSRRDASLVCVVEEPKDVQAVERTREFRGRYHVLGGALDPLSGIGPEQLRIRELLNRIGERVDGVDVAEVIIATDPNTEGEATATLPGADAA
jgi:recombination protein RecR